MYVSIKKKAKKMSENKETSKESIAVVFVRTKGDLDCGGGRECRRKVNGLRIYFGAVTKSIW